jgi:dynein heavy chain, axonemal
VTDLDGLSSIVSLLRDVRERESTLELDLAAVLDLYRMLEHYLPGGLVSEEEARERALIRVTWRRLLDFAEEVHWNLRRTLCRIIYT